MRVIAPFGGDGLASIPFHNRGKLNMNRIYSALTSHRDKVAKGEKGFTLIELLIVVIIIGVLAAIAIPIYLSVQGNARDASAKSSVTEAKTAVVAYLTQEGVVPTTAEGIELAEYFESADIPITYFGLGEEFCISAQYQTTGKIYKITDSSSVNDDETDVTACTTVAG